MYLKKYMHVEKVMLQMWKFVYFKNKWYFRQYMEYYLWNYESNQCL